MGKLIENANLSDRMEATMVPNLNIPNIPFGVRTGTGSLLWEPEVAPCAGAWRERNESLPVLFRSGREG